MAEEYVIPEKKKIEIKRLANLVEAHTRDLFYAIPIEHPRGVDAKHEVEAISDALTEVLGKLEIESSPEITDPVIRFLTSRG